MLLVAQEIVRSKDTQCNTDMSPDIYPERGGVLDEPKRCLRGRLTIFGSFSEIFGNLQTFSENRRKRSYDLRAILRQLSKFDLPN